ncbi:MAG: HNH endonuclease [Bacilli bacterium]
MNIYEQVKKEIMNMKIDKAHGNNGKLYKHLLILSMLDYHLDCGDETKAFNNPTSAEVLLDFFVIYLENELVRDLTYSNKTNIFESNKILRTLRELPMFHITRHSSGGFSKFFFNDLPKVTKPPRKLSEMAKTFEIRIEKGTNLEKMANVIRSACQERIRKETGLIISGSLVTDLKKPDPKTSKYYRVGQNQYRRKMIEKYNGKCAFCGFHVEHVLVASHAKRWEACDSVFERLDDNNGFLLCANHDKMFDSGHLTIDVYNNKYIFSNFLNKNDLKQCKSTFPNDTLNFTISANMKKYLRVHTETVFK